MPSVSVLLSASKRQVKYSAAAHETAQKLQPRVALAAMAYCKMCASFADEVMRLMQVCTLKAGQVLWTKELLWQALQTGPTHRATTSRWRADRDMPARPTARVVSENLIFAEMNQVISLANVLYSRLQSSSFATRCVSV